MAESPLSLLPDELLEAIVFHLPPQDTLAFGATCRRSNKITYEPLIWRRHCVERWRYWEAHHEIEQKLERPPVQTKWRTLYQERHRVEKKAQELFDQMLETQQHRLQRLEEIAKIGYDAKNLMLSFRDKTPEDAEDVLARRYYANVILGQIHRASALAKWARLPKRQMVRLEEVLGAYDLFVLSGKRGDLSDIDKELDRLAQAIRTRDSEFDGLSIRKKAIQIASYLRAEGLVGNENEADYHALRNNFIGIALFDQPHSSLPLQSVAIYCAVARRLGVNAKPSNYPHHVHAVIEAPRGVTLDGGTRPDLNDDEARLEMMHMDPWRSSNEVPRDHLVLRLSQMGAPQGQYEHHLGATTNMEMALRTGRNIMNSVQEERDRQRGGTRKSIHPDVESAWYSMLWSMLVLGDTSPATTLLRRRQCLPYLMEHFQLHFPEDLGLLETVVVPMFENEREHHSLMHVITNVRKADQNKKPPNLRPRTEDLRAWMIPGRGGVSHKIGTHFRHKRLGYEGFIVGWDVRCSAEQRWIQQMRVDDLPRGREQPFYNIVADDKSVRYVAEENIQPLYEKPTELLMALAGRYFKRWDDETGAFVSNIRDEYPDD